MKDNENEKNLQKALLKLIVGDFIEDSNLIISDLDGVVVKGDTKIEGAIEILSEFKNYWGKDLFFITNHPSIWKNYIIKNMLDGNKSLNLTENEIITPNDVINDVLQEKREEKKDLENKIIKVYLIGGAPTENTIINIKDFKIKLSYRSNILNEEGKENSNHVNLILLGFPSIYNGDDLDMALNILKEKNSILMVTSEDLYYPLPNDKLRLGPGIFANALKDKSRKDLEIWYLGKPEKYLYNKVKTNYSFVPDYRVIMIGDNFKTDVEFSLNNRTKCIHVNTGVDRININDNENFLKEFIENLNNNYKINLDEIGTIVSSILILSLFYFPEIKNKILKNFISYLKNNKNEYKYLPIKLEILETLGYIFPAMDKINKEDYLEFIKSIIENDKVNINLISSSLLSLSRLIKISNKLDNNFIKENNVLIDIFYKMIEKLNNINKFNIQKIIFSLENILDDNKIESIYKVKNELLDLEFILIQNLLKIKSIPLSNQIKLLELIADLNIYLNKNIEYPDMFEIRFFISEILNKYYNIYLNNPLNEIKKMTLGDLFNNEFNFHKKLNNIIKNNKNKSVIEFLNDFFKIFKKDSINMISIPSLGNLEAKNLFIQFNEIIKDIHEEILNIKSVHSAIVLKNKDNIKILLDNRNRDPLRGYFDFFGGTLNIEDIIQSEDLSLDFEKILKRELEEELGIKINMEKLKRNLNSKPVFNREVISYRRKHLFDDYIYILELDNLELNLPSIESHSFIYLNVDKDKNKYIENLEKLKPMHPIVKNTCLKIYDIYYGEIK